MPEDILSGLTAFAVYFERDFPHPPRHEAPKADNDSIARVHSQQYIDFIAEHAPTTDTMTALDAGIEAGLRAVLVGTK